LPKKSAKDLAFMALESTFETGLTPAKYPQGLEKSMSANLF